jgi:molybdopterin/thiamine biosynthesis adenylyltransferase/rhodanese-related sulfurtransferase
LLNQKEIVRYSRHFPVIGLEGQKKLKQASVLCVGAGGLAAGALPALIAAGIGKLGVVDGDIVELSNLQRQIIFRESQLGMNKAEAVKAQLQELNSTVEIEIHSYFLDADNAQNLLASFDIIIDATDNFTARYLLNTVTRQLKKPLVSASIFQFDAQLSVFNYRNGPCYECLYPAPPPEGVIPSCVTGGVLGVLPSVVGGLQATEVIKLIVSVGEVLSGKLLTLDLSSSQFSVFPIQKAATCCETHCAEKNSRIDINEEEPMIQEMTVEKLASVMTESNYFIVDVREGFEREICSIGGLHVPLGELPQRVSEVPADKTVVVYCRSGVRSLKGAAVLQDAGCSDVLSLAGGIMAWREKIDPSMMAY